MDVEPLKQSANNIGDWGCLPFFNNGQFDRVCQRLTEETRPVFPAAGRILRAYQLVQPSDVRVVILGQDPYPQPDRAVGLAFGVPVGEMPEKGSLPNMFRKLRDDPEFSRTAPEDLTEHCGLTGWANQGVLLLNTALTVPQYKPGGHGSIGWAPLITQTLRHLGPRPDIAWFLCGYKAKKREPSNRCPRALVIKTGHPSRAHLFDVRRPFSRINEFLGNRRIDWWQA